MQGAMADAVGIVLSFLIPALAYCYITGFGAWCARIMPESVASAPTPVKGAEQKSARCA
jgi:FHS family L-fucose permease-like MFS transporter